MVIGATARVSQDRLGDGSQASILILGRGMTFHEGAHHETLIEVIPDAWRVVGFPGDGNAQSVIMMGNNP